MTLGDFLNKITQEIVNPLIVLVFALAVVVFGWGVVLYLSGTQGSDERVEKAKKIMWWGLVGMFVLVSIWGMVFLLCDFAGTCIGARFTPSQTSAPPPPAGSGSETCNPPAIPPCFCDPDTGFYHCPGGEIPDDPPGPVTLTSRQNAACLNSPSVCEPCLHFLDEGRPRDYVRCVRNILGF